MMINILGNGLTTRNLSLFLRKLGYVVQVFDEAHGAGLLSPFDIKADVTSPCIISPGIPPNKNYLKFFTNIIGEYDFVYYLIYALKTDYRLLFSLDSLDIQRIRNEYQPLETLFTIWVSGTNGKTSTTEMISVLTGYRACGNIGIPFFDAVLSEMDAKDLVCIPPLPSAVSECLPSPEIKLRIAKIASSFSDKHVRLVLETSSFSMHYTRVVYPDAYLLTNISQDHLDWHGSMDNYRHAKLSVLERMKGMAFVPEYVNKVAVNCVLYFFKNTHDLMQKFSLEDDRGFEEPFKFNLFLSLALLRSLNLQVEIERIKNYKIGDYKMQELDNSFLDSSLRDEIIFVNDSKATNPHATLSALDQYKNEHVFLILGGDTKGVDLRELMEYIRSVKNIKVFVIGKSTRQIVYDLYEYALDCITLEQALKDILDSISLSPLRGQKKIILLSPAAASFDQYESYEKRGEEFNRLSREIFNGFKM